MKKNKKLFLASIAAMGAVAIGTGAVSTFAWYTASASVNIAATGEAYSISTTSTSATLSGLTVTFTISSGDTVELSHYDSTDIKFGAVPNGVDAETTTDNWDGNNTTHKLVGTYSITASASPTDAQKEALKDKTFVVQLEALGNVVILDAASDDITDNASRLAKAKTTKASPTFEVSFNSSGAIIADCDELFPYFRVEPNNLSGREYKAANADTAPKGKLPATTWAAMDDHDAGSNGDIVLVSSVTQVWKLTGSVAEDVALVEGTNANRIDHGADKIAIKSGQTSISPKP